VSKIAILPFDVRPSFRAKGLHLVFQNWNFTQFFAVRPSCRAKGLDLIFQKWNFRQFFFVSTFQFDVVKLRTSFCRLTFIACERVASGFSKLQFYTTFCGPTWFDLHFVRKGDAAPENIRISLRVCASDTHDLRRGLTPKWLLCKMYSWSWCRWCRWCMWCRCRWCKDVGHGNNVCDVDVVDSDDVGDAEDVGDVA